MLELLYFHINETLLETHCSILLLRFQYEEKNNQTI